MNYLPFMIALIYAISVTCGAKYAVIRNNYVWQGWKWGKRSGGMQPCLACASLPSLYVRPVWGPGLMRS